MLTGLILSGKGLFFRNARAIALFFLYVFHVSGRGAVRFPFVKRRFPPGKTYVSRKENIENVGRFVQICPCSERFLKCFLEYCMRKSRLLWWTGDSVSYVFGCFSGFWPSCKEISCRIFRVSAVLLYRFGVHLCLFLLHMRSCARTHARAKYIM